MVIGGERRVLQTCKTGDEAVEQLPQMELPPSVTLFVPGALVGDGGWEMVGGSTTCTPLHSLQSLHLL